VRRTAVVGALAVGTASAYRSGTTRGSGSLRYQRMGASVKNWRLSDGSTKGKERE